MEGSRVPMALRPNLDFEFVRGALDVVKILSTQQTNRAANGLKR